MQSVMDQDPSSLLITLFGAFMGEISNIFPKQHGTLSYALLWVFSGRGFNSPHSGKWLASSRLARTNLFSRQCWGAGRDAKEGELLSCAPKTCSPVGHGATNRTWQPKPGPCFSPGEAVSQSSPNPSRLSGLTNGALGGWHALGK